ncbi:MAG: hypothetical protein KAH99_01635, partial [Verrucomicrobia bacterium]|nr:hypothetical protein [Verrucomicrobiota bacterium]
MNRFTMTILGFLWIFVGSYAQEGSDPPTRLIVHDKEGLFPAGQSISVARTRRLGQIGRSRSYRSIVMGTADVYGNGPYDLFLLPDRLFPFRGFQGDGTPYYGEPIKIQGQPMGGAVITGPAGAIYSISAAKKKVKV